MVKVFFVFLVLVTIFLLLPIPAYAVCSIANPGSVSPGQNVTINVSSVITAERNYRVDVTPSTSYNIQPIPPDRLIVTLPRISAGTYNLAVIGTSGGAEVDRCVLLNYVVQGPPPDAPGEGVRAPKYWLPFVFPGFGPTPSLGISFFTKNLIPFLVDTAVFLLLVSSLIFLIIGGIKWTTAGGDKEALTKAKGTVTWAAVGLVLGLASFIILAVLGQFFNIDLLKP